MATGLLLQSFFMLDGDAARPLSTDALGSQRTRLTNGVGKHESPGAILSQRLLLIARVARQHVDAADQLALHIHCQRGLMPIERFAGALAPVPHLRIVDTNVAVFFGAFLDLTTATGFLFHILSDQSLQQGRVGLNRFVLFGMIVPSLLGQAQQSPAILYDL